ncbi:MAG TPA: RAMP superfamily CRISPR-associated protein [Candidatus Acidoferrales bacterium]|nr:RAMP superfamily CRISPR-associated protein [Candidatus Acidoferrales bacterium]
MTKLKYVVSFTTPAFLGDAEQSGRWRTPPFKALLRQWWRVVYAHDHGFNVDVGAMRSEEGLLFGNAWLENKFCKSQVRLRIDRWESGTLKTWNGLEQARVPHPEVQRASYKVGPHAYLGYGPLDGRGGTKLNERVKAVVNVGESATFSIAVPNESAPHIERALWLMDRYGTVGGRSRNGWGSFTLTPTDGTPKLDGQVPLRNWKACLDCDWPHAIGTDANGALIWQTKKAYDDWKTLMRDLAIIKIGLRTQFVFPPSVKPPHPLPLERHWLSYPITTHTVRDWQKQNLRLPNSLRFKVRCDPGHPKKLRGVIFHMPCVPPLDFRPDKPAIEQTWQTVHELLGELCKPSGRTYSMIADQTRRSKLKPELDKVLLELVKE